MVKRRENTPQMNTVNLEVKRPTELASQEPQLMQINNFHQIVRLSR